MLAQLKTVHILRFLSLFLVVLEETVALAVMGVRQALVLHLEQRLPVARAVLVAPEGRLMAADLLHIFLQPLRQF
jgi:hypothetical protein